MVNRPYVNLELYKGAQLTFTDSDRPSYRSNPNRQVNSVKKIGSNKMIVLSQWKNKYMNDQISKRHLNECLENNSELCENEQEQSEKPFLITGKVPLPHPIYMESSDDDSNSEENLPFDNLPPLHPSKIMKEEKNWVMTWDKEKTGLPEVASLKETSKRRRH